MKKKQIEIANTLNISKYIVSRAVTKDARYKSEKQTRKDNSKLKHTKDTINYIQNKRKQKREKMDYETIRVMHNQAVQELSGGKTIGNIAFKKCNSSIYRYNSKSNTYNLIKGINVSKDVPKKIDWSGK